jgi:hypothetical protein
VSELIRRPAAELCSAGRTRASVPTWVVGGARLLLCALREIFDEAAYSRFLARQGMTSCPSAYAAFLGEQEAIKARRPKCC